MGMLKNTKHELFAQGMAKGLSQYAAYQAAGYKARGDSARTNSTRLLTNADICSRIAELKARIVENVQISREWILEQLVANVKGARKNEDYAPANKALELLGKELGMFIDRREVGRPGEFANLSDAELDRVIEDATNHLELEAVDVTDAEPLEDFEDDERELDAIEHHPEHS